MEKLPRQKYTKEFRAQAVKLVIEQDLTVPETVYCVNIFQAARRLSMSDQTLSNWVFKARHGKLEAIDSHRKPVTDVEAENAKLKRELAEARMERDVLKKTIAYFAKVPLRGHALMSKLRTDYPIKLLCRVLEVSKSGYHAFIARRPSTRAKENARLEIAIEAAHVRTRKSYGPLRLQDELHDDGFTVSIGRIRRLRKKLNIRCKQLRKFKMTTISNHGLPVAFSYPS